MKAEKCYYLISALNEFSYEVPYLSYFIFSALGLGYTYLYAGIFALFFGVLDYPTGGLADRMGRKRVFALGTFLVGINFLILAAYTNPLTVALAASLFGFGGALQSGSLEAWITDEMKRENRFNQLDKVFGRATSLSLIADVLAGVSGSIITYIGGYWWTISFAGIISMIATSSALLVMRENFGVEKKEPYLRLLKVGANTLFRRKHLLLLSISQMIFVTGVYAYWETLTPIYGERKIPEAFFGVIGAAMHLPAVITTAYSHKLSRKLGTANSTLLLSGTWTLFCLLMILLVDPYPTIVIAIILESIYATRYPIMEFWRNQLIPSALRATVLSGISTMEHTGQAIILFVLSPIVETYGTKAGLISAIAITATAIPFLLKLAKEKH